MNMSNSIFLILILGVCLIIGISWRINLGKVKSKVRSSILESELGVKLGKLGTVVVFTTTFCSECRTTKAIVKDVVKDYKEVTYVEVDAESNLDLVRRVDIRSTPTTIFLDSKGFEIARAKGAPKRDQLIKAIKAI
jgi:thiol-disulfide isomerase/thioredoxin